MGTKISVHLFEKHFRCIYNWHISLTVVVLICGSKIVFDAFDSDQDVDLAAELESAEAFERQGNDKTYGFPAMKRQIFFSTNKTY